MTQWHQPAARLAKAIRKLVPRGRRTVTIKAARTALDQAGVDVDRLLVDARELERAVIRAPVTLPHPTAPTRQRMAHAAEAAIAAQIGPGTDKVHLLQWPIDRAAAILTADEYAAAQRLRDAYLYRVSHAKTGDYGTSPGGSDPSSRLPITPRQERAGREFNAAWLRCGPAIRLIVRNFVFEDAAPGLDRPMSAEEFGKRYGRTTDARRARGVTDGAIKTACGALATIWREYDHWRVETGQAVRKRRDDAGRIAQNSSTKVAGVQRNIA